MIDKIEKILTQYSKHKIWFNVSHNQLCDLHNDMLRSRNNWRFIAFIFIGWSIGSILSLIF